MTNNSCREKKKVLHFIRTLYDCDDQKHCQSGKHSQKDKRDLTAAVKPNGNLLKLRAISPLLYLVSKHHVKKFNLFQRQTESLAQKKHNTLAKFSD